MEKFFKPTEKTAFASLPFVTRPGQREVFMSFASENDGFEALIHRNVQDVIWREARSAAPNETIGLLAGRVLRDEQGPYTLALAAEGARPSEVEATPSHVRISSAGHAQVRSRLEGFAYGLDIIGWYHSHPRYPARFSPVDITEQSTWRDANHLGIVISGVDEYNPLGVYRGPKANLLTPVLAQHLIGPEKHVEVLTPVAVPTVTFTEGRFEAPTFSPQPSKRAANAAHGIVSIASLIIVFGLLGMLIGVVWVERRLTRMEERLTTFRLAQAQSSTIIPPQPSPSPLNLSAPDAVNYQDLPPAKPDIGAKALPLQPRAKETNRRQKRQKKSNPVKKPTPSEKQQPDPPGLTESP